MTAEYPPELSRVIELNRAGAFDTEPTYCRQVNRLRVETLNRSVGENAQSHGVHVHRPRRHSRRYGVGSLRQVRHARREVR